MYRLASDLAAPARLTSAGYRLLCMASMSGPYMPALYTVTSTTNGYRRIRPKPRSSSTGIRVRHRTLLLKRDIYICIHISSTSPFLIRIFSSLIRSSIVQPQIRVKITRTRINDTSTNR